MRGVYKIEVFSCIKNYEEYPFSFNSDRRQEYWDKYCRKCTTKFSKFCGLKRVIETRRVK